MEFIIILFLLVVVYWLFYGFKGVFYMLSLHKILRDEYGWTQSVIDTMWYFHQDELNKLKIEGQSTRRIAEHIDQHLSQFKSAFM
jgi:hypothetical protein